MSLLRDEKGKASMGSVAGMSRFVLVAAVLTAACGGYAPPRDTMVPISPQESTVRWWDHQPMTPTLMHSLIHAMMQKCTGVRGDFWRIHWYSAHFVQRAADYERLGGVWIATVARSIIILDRRKTNDWPTVSEEILHSLLRGGQADHEDPRFKECLIKGA